jgi:BirA family biotin operon repressor/biotin-[acetyl-CoA-carboxylase] ligase|tara:strand:- start:2846 stop:3586 length:741 start_codon:yes stop_codon:yes gene_type:complete
MTQWPAGVDRIVLDSTTSTMTEAAQMAASITSPTWIMAHQQTDGRGRRGRAWLTPKGNLTATLVFEPHCTPAQAAQRSFLAANALYNALAIYVPSEKLSLKWPNDVLLSGGKVAGILLESAGHHGAVSYLSIGIGVNLQTIPQGVKDAAFGPTSLKAAGGWDVDSIDFLTTLANAYADQEALLATHGFTRIRTDWLKHAAKLGEVITARTTLTEITGTFKTIDDDGNLVLITGAGPQVIPAADVYF